MFFKPNIIKEAKQLTSTPELQRLVQSAESPPGSDPDEAMSELCLFCLLKSFTCCYSCCFHDYMIKIGVRAHLFVLCIFLKVLTFEINVDNESLFKTLNAYL